MHANMDIFTYLAETSFNLIFLSNEFMNLVRLNFEL